MLSSLKNLKSKTQEKAKELVSTITHEKDVSRNNNQDKKSSPPYMDFSYMENGVFYTISELKEKVADYIYNDSGKSFVRQRLSAVPINQEMWAEYSKMLNSFSKADQNSLNQLLKDNGYPSFHHKERTGILIIGNVAKEVVGELYSKKPSKVKFAALEENLDKNFVPFPVARLAIAGKDPVCLMNFLEASKCKEYGIDAITMCSPDENKTRGVRLELCQDEDGKEIRTYEILNGTYDMDLNWEVEGKKCQMKISVSADGSAKILQRNGVTDEEIYAHTEVMVGKEYEPKSLYEALGLQQTQGKGKIQPKLCKRSQPQKSKEIKQLVEKSPEVESALKEFASEVKEESSESMKPLTDMTKADVKGASSMQR